MSSSAAAATATHASVVVMGVKTEKEEKRTTHNDKPLSDYQWYLYFIFMKLLTPTVAKTTFNPYHPPNKEPYISMWNAITRLDLRLERLMQNLMDSEYFSLDHHEPVPKHIQNRRTMLKAARHADRLAVEPVLPKEKEKLRCQVTNQHRGVFKCHFNFKKEHKLTVQCENTTLLLCEPLMKLCQHVIYWCNITDACEVLALQLRRAHDAKTIMSHYDQFVVSVPDIEKREQLIDLTERHIRGFIAKTIERYNIRFEADSQPPPPPPSVSSNSGQPKKQKKKPQQQFKKSHVFKRK